MTKSGARSGLLPILSAAGALGVALALASACSAGAPAGATGAGGGIGNASSSSGAGGSTVASTSSSSSSSTTTSSSGTSTNSSTSGAGGAGASGTGGGTGGALATGTGGGSGGSCAPLVGTTDYPLETEQNNLPATANPLTAGTHGFTASICPIGDVDVFSVVVATDGATLTVATSDGLGNCPPGAATLLRVFDGNGVQLGATTNSGSGKCSLLTPILDPGVAGLPMGTYYAQVESADGNPISSYVIDMKVQAPTCGDSVVQYAYGEQCDDGNIIAGDGCSPTCQLEGNFSFETEPNDTAAISNPMDGFDGIIGAIEPVGDVDWYTFDVTVPGSNVRVSVDDGLTGCPLGFSSNVHLYGPSKQVLVGDDSNGPGTCSLIDPELDPQAANLPVGTYFLKVEFFNGTGTTPFYVVKAKVMPPACGDGVIEAGEQCDQPGDTGGVGCSSTCQFDAPIEPENEPNDFLMGANILGETDGGQSYVGFSGAIEPVMDSDWYAFTVTVAGSVVNLAVGDGLGGCPTGADPIMTLFDANSNQLAIDDDSGPRLCSRITPGNYPVVASVPAGTYYVEVAKSANDDVIPYYVLTIDVHAPGCGDGVIEAGEQCDDGAANATAGDPCSSTCQVVAPWEIEPNNAKSQATPQWPGVAWWYGSIVPKGDRDYYAFTLAAATNVTLTTHTLGDATTCPGDTMIRLLDMNGALLEAADDGGIGKCSKLAKSLPAGNYYVWVQAANDASAIPRYELDLGAP